MFLTISTIESSGRGSHHAAVQFRELLLREEGPVAAKFAAKSIPDLRKHLMHAQTKKRHNVKTAHPPKTQPLPLTISDAILRCEVYLNPIIHMLSTSSWNKVVCAFLSKNGSF